ncbi:MAG TPA: cytochrome c [Pyrinomonadaceae bacterium]
MNRILKGASAHSAIVFSIFVAFVITADIFGAVLQKRGNSSAQRLKKADELFKENCARCHGADGSGDTPLGHRYKTPDFTDPAWWQKNNVSKQQLVNIVSRGKDDMPAFRKKLKPSEISLLVDHVRRFKPAK